MLFILIYIRARVIMYFGTMGVPCYVRGRPLDNQGGAWIFLEINNLMAKNREINKLILVLLEINNFSQR
jgi:hypothetical protein